MEEERLALQGSSPPDLIEVGEVERDGLRLWRARQALSSGEKLLAAQIVRHDSYQARASSVLGWNVTITVALEVASISHHAPRAAIAAAAAGLISAFACVAILWPATWKASAQEPRVIIASPHRNELQHTEVLALTYGAAFDDNERVVTAAARWLRLAWAAFGAMPAAALAAYLIPLP